MQFGIVEGDLGIFPDPIARLFRLLGRAFKRDRRNDNVHSGGQDQRLDKESGPSSE